VGVVVTHVVAPVLLDFQEAVGLEQTLEVEYGEYRTQMEELITMLLGVEGVQLEVLLVMEAEEEAQEVAALTTTVVLEKL
jgi:hypothetical protein